MPVAFLIFCLSILPKSILEWKDVLYQMNAASEADLQWCLRRTIQNSWWHPAQCVTTWSGTHSVTRESFSSTCSQLKSDAAALATPADAGSLLSLDACQSNLTPVSTMHTCYVIKCYSQRATHLQLMVSLFNSSALTPNHSVQIRYDNVHRVVQKIVSYRSLSISSLNIDQFSQFIHQ